jgi:hypothetical protein
VVLNALATTRKVLTRRASGACTHNGRHSMKSCLQLQWTAEVQQRYKLRLL